MFRVMTLVCFWFLKGSFADVFISPVSQMETQYPFTVLFLRAFGGRNHTQLLVTFLSRQREMKEGLSVHCSRLESPALGLVTWTMKMCNFVERS